MDVFAHGEDDFLALLDGLEREHDRVLLLGDIFQCEHGRWFGGRVARARSPW